MSILGSELELLSSSGNVFDNAVSILYSTKKNAEAHFRTNDQIHNFIRVCNRNIAIGEWPRSGFPFLESGEELFLVERMI